MTELLAAISILQDCFDIWPIWRGYTGSWGYWELRGTVPLKHLKDEELIEYTHYLINKLA